jgi:general transcription factor IIIA
MHPKCNGRTFASQHNLRAHLKLHEQHKTEAHIHRADRADAPEDAIDTEGSQPRKRRRGGELGRDWKCDFAGCDKDFKSVCSASGVARDAPWIDYIVQKNALTTHHNVVHLGQRNHACPHVHCNSAFGYKHLLERHLAKLHSSKSVHAETASDEEAPATDVDDAMDIEAITGKAYAARLQNAMSIRCPYPHVDALVASTATPDTSGPSSSKTCEHILTRAYDLRRHLRSEHGVDTEKEKVDTWVSAQRHAHT